MIFFLDQDFTKSLIGLHIVGNVGRDKKKKKW
jgi:hypothetical protein